MWIIYMLIEFPKILASFLVYFFYFILRYTIYYFFASKTIKKYLIYIFLFLKYKL